MSNYIDGFILPIPKKHLDEYKAVAEQVAAIWKEHGALEYFEFLGDDLKLEGTRSFKEAVDLQQDEAVIFGWVAFPSKDVRDSANEAVPKEARMTEIVAPLTIPDRLIFDASRMVYGGFRSLVGGD